MTRTITFKIPARDLEALVTIGLDDGPTLAFRPGYGTWGPPIAATYDSNDDRPMPERIGDLLDDLRDAGWFVMEVVTRVTDPFDPSDELEPAEVESCVVYDATIKDCPLCGHPLSSTWDRNSVKRCATVDGCGAEVRNGLVR